MELTYSYREGKGQIPDAETLEISTPRLTVRDTDFAMPVGALSRDKPPQQTSMKHTIVFFFRGATILWSTGLKTTFTS